MSGSKKSRMKKGAYFTIDALLGAGIMLVALVLISSSYISETAPPSNNFAADDLLMALSNLKVSEANSSYVKSLISSGDITKLNNTILEQIGEFWAEGNFDKARNISKEFIQDYVPNNVGVGFFISDEEIFARNKTSYNTVISRKRLISGIQKNRTSDGYLARAIALKSKKNTTLVVAGDVITSSVEKSPSGNNFNEVNVTYDVFIPENSTILGSEWFVEAAWTGIDFDAYINGQYVGSAIPSDKGRKTFQNLNAYLDTGAHNNATVIFNFGNSNNPEGGDDGATHFTVNYSTTSVNTLPSLNKKNLAVVLSNASIRYKKPIFAAGSINSIGIFLNVTAGNVSLNYTLDGVNYFISKKNASGGNLTWSNSEIVAALANNGHSLSSLSNRYFWLVFDLDTYTQKTTKVEGRKILPNSYVDIDFTPTSNIYGMIDITKIVPISSVASQCGGSFNDFYRNLTWRFNVTNYTVPLMLDSQLAWLYTSGKDPSQTVKANQNVLYSHPPSPLIKEFARYGYTQQNDNFASNINNYTLGFTTGYCIHPSDSIVTYTSLINNFVGYGATFNSLQEAKDDASQRLSQVLGDFATATEINNDVITLSKVPSMWGPSIMEVRIWQ